VSRKLSYALARSVIPPPRGDVFALNL